MRVAGDRRRPVVGQDPELVPTPEHRMRGDHLAAVTHLQASVAAVSRVTTCGHSGGGGRVDPSDCP